MTRAQALSTLAAVPALALLSPTASGPAAPLVSAVSAAAWTCTGWLLLVLVLEQGSRLPGAAGRAAGALARRVAPRSVRALVRVAVGAGLAASLLTGTAALAEDRTPTIAGSSSDYLDWPGLAPATAGPVGPAAPPTRPAATTGPTTPASPAAPAVAPRHPSPPAPRPTHPAAAPEATSPDVPAGPDGTVVVRSGDSLWTLAARALGPGTTDSRVAQEWPRWWAANRSVVGDHPGLIHPGDRLTAPRPLGNDS